MNKKVIASLSQIKEILQISGNNLDSFLNFQIQSATNQILEILNINELIKTEYSDELVKNFFKDRLLLKNPHIDLTVSIVVKDEKMKEITQTLDFFTTKDELFTLRFKNSSGSPTCLHGSHFWVDYTAGITDTTEIPNDLKMALALIIQANFLRINAGRISELEKTAGGSSEFEKIKKYKKGTKEIEYALPNESFFTKGLISEGSFEEILEKYGKIYSRPILF